jgi:hypothetical protein
MLDGEGYMRQRLSRGDDVRSFYYLHITGQFICWAVAFDHGNETKIDLAPLVSFMLYYLTCLADFESFKWPPTD